MAKVCDLGVYRFGCNYRNGARSLIFFCMRAFLFFFSHSVFRVGSELDDLVDCQYCTVTCPNMKFRNVDVSVNGILKRLLSGSARENLN